MSALIAYVLLVAGAGACAAVSCWPAALVATVMAIALAYRYEIRTVSTRRG